MIRAAVAVVLGLAEIATAGPASTKSQSAASRDARAHAKSSITVYLSSALWPGPMVPIRVGADGAVRFHLRHIAIEARLGVGGAASLTAFAGASAWHGGASLGGALSLGSRVVLTPMVGYDAFVAWEPYAANVIVHYMTFEVPVTIIFDRVVIEPYVQVGIARYRGVNDPVLVVGPRLGIAL